MVPAGRPRLDASAGRRCLPGARPVERGGLGQAIGVTAHDQQGRKTTQEHTRASGSTHDDLGIDME
jgi:hypothetical protein